MPSASVRIDAARHDRGLVPSRSPLESKLKAEPILLLWRRLIDLAVDEAKRVRFGEPTDAAIIARWWIEVEQQLDPHGRELRVTFERCCAFLGIDPATERAKLLKEIDGALTAECMAYVGKRLELRKRAVLTTAGCPATISKTYALLLVSQAEYEDTAGINRADPPQWKKRLDRIAAQAG